ncbi:MAG: hypothetical protein JXO22_01225 [Phycisphaerae bacterium]|nr:hypothetical protein [Phycisphaerae bacterium]
MRTTFMVFVAGVLLVGLTGCVTVKAPERIDIGGGRAERVDSSRVPATSSHEQARAELEKAYRYIQSLENANKRLEDKAAEYKRERDQCEDRLEKCEERSNRD